MTLLNNRMKSGLALLAAGSMLALGAPMAASAQSAFTTLDKTSAANVRFSSAERGKAIEAGSSVTVAGQGFKPGQKVQLLYGATPLAGGDLTADGEGKLTGTITVPANAVAGTHPIVVVAQGPYYATVADLKVSPTVPLSGQQNYTLTEAKATRGQYQSAYSPKSNALFVTSSVGRPPIKQSELVKLNADTLKVLARVTPQAAPATANGRDPGIFGVYGIAVDDSKGTVWTTNTRQNTISVYNQADLSLVKQFEPGAVGHPRDVVIVPGANKAYVSTSGKEVVVVDTGSLQVSKKIAPASLKRGEDFGAASLSFNPAKNLLYVASMSNEVAIIDTRTDEVVKVLPVPGAKGVIGIADDPQTGRIFVASQGSDNLIVLDADGKVIADTPVGAGALNVAFDPVKRVAYVANRGASTITVVDVDGKIVANLGPAPMVNHISIGKNGTVYAVDKSAGMAEGGLDSVIRIRPKK
ncbi:MAG: hypothetical protein E2598_03390 [Sphingobium sp.]|nr:hypothetical protein [Sphingobium sp.]